MIQHTLGGNRGLSTSSKMCVDCRSVPLLLMYQTLGLSTHQKAKRRRDVRGGELFSAKPSGAMSSQASHNAAPRLAVRIK